MVTKRSKSTKIILVILLLVMISGTAYAGYVFMTQPQKAGKKIVTPEQTVSAIVESAAAADDTTVAQKKLQELAQNETDSQKKVVYLSGEAKLYFSSQDYKGALQVLLSIEQLEKTSLNAGNIGGAYEGLGDYANAAKYYEIAASRSEKPASSAERAPYNEYMVMKREAEAQIK